MSTAAVLFLVAACAGSAPNRPGNMGRPLVGDCLAPMSRALIDQNPLPPRVPCDRPHGGEIVAVWALKAGPNSVYPAGPNPEADELGETCQRVGGAVDQWTGLMTFDTSTTLAGALFGSSYLPTKAQWKAGARWLACGAVLDQTTARSYRGTSKEALTHIPIPAAFTRCGARLTADTYRDVTCSEPHVVEALGQVVLGQPGDAYPGDDAIDATRERKCQLIVRRLFPRGLLSTYRLIDRSPNATGWAEGHRVAWCDAQLVSGETVTSLLAG